MNYNTEVIGKDQSRAARTSQEHRGSRPPVSQPPWETAGAPCRRGFGCPLEASQLFLCTQGQRGQIMKAVNYSFICPLILVLPGLSQSPLLYKMERPMRNLIVHLTLTRWVLPVVLRCLLPFSTLLHSFRYFVSLSPLLQQKGKYKHA